MKTKTSLNKEAAIQPWSLSCSSLFVSGPLRHCLGNNLPWFSHRFTRSVSALQDNTIVSKTKMKREWQKYRSWSSWPPRQAGLCPPWPVKKREQGEQRLALVKAALCRGLWADLVLNSPIREISKSRQEPETSVHPVSFHWSLQEKVLPMRFLLLLCICTRNKHLLALSSHQRFITELCWPSKANTHHSSALKKEMDHPTVSYVF